MDVNLVTHLQSLNEELSEPYGYIYKVTDSLNKHNLPNPVYIGQKMGKFRPGYYGSGKYIKNVIKEYGIENFKLEIVAQASSREELNKLEISWVKKNNCIWPNGYNLVPGGGVNSAWFVNHPDREAIRKKFSQSHLGNHPSEETRDKMRQVRLGKPHSEEVKANMRGPRGAYKPQKEPRTKEYRANISKVQSGRVWIHNPELNINKKVRPEEVQGYLENGYQLSKLPISDEVRDNYKKAWVLRKQEKLKDLDKDIEKI